jgi:hypothetical protein
MAIRDLGCIRGNDDDIGGGDGSGAVSGRFSDDRLFDAVNVLLTLQNADGGWATYENNRGYGKSHTLDDMFLVVLSFAPLRAHKNL